MTITHTNQDLEERCKGSLLGAAIGDALGMPTEYISKDSLQRRYGGKVTKFERPSQNHPCAHLNAGQYTDDTQQVIILAESLVRNSGFNLHDFAKDMGVWAHRCLTEPDYNRFAGGTSVRAALEIYDGKDPQKTGKPSPTCGSAMRIAPVGLFYHNDRKRLQEVAKDAARITHDHPATIDAAVLIADIIGNLVNGKEPREAVEQARTVIDSSLTKNIDYVIEKSKTHPDELAKQVGASESVYETVPMAVSCFLFSPEDFAQAVINAANLVPGDTDSIACIAGAMAGARNGYAQIPKQFKEEIEDGPRLEQLAKDLAKASLNR